jgi:hypothetical protein
MSIIIDYPFLPFSDEEMNECIQQPEVSSQTNSSKWSLIKQRVGYLRHDLTRDLEVTEMGIPKVKAYRGEFPEFLISIREMKKCCNPYAWVHGFSEDLILDRFLTNIHKNIDLIPRKGGIFTPDFSLHLDMHDPESRYNLYRGRACGQIMQRAGKSVITTLSWDGNKSLDYFTDGVEPEGIYAVSNIGTNGDYVGKKIFREGLFLIKRLLYPKGIIVYGSPIDNAYGMDIRYFPNLNIERLRKIS